MIVPPRSMQSMATTETSLASKPNAPRKLPRLVTRLSWVALLTSTRVQAAPVSTSKTQRAPLSLPNQKLVGDIALGVDGAVAPLKHESLHGTGAFFSAAYLLQRAG